MCVARYVVPFVVSGQSDVKVVYSVSLFAVVDDVSVEFAVTDGFTDTEVVNEVEFDVVPVAPTTTELVVLLRPVALVMGAECVCVAK